MRIRKPGKIRDHLWALGREESTLYLLEGTEGSMIISGGMSVLVPDLVSQFREFGIDEERIQRLLILHSHFDHVGIVPFFKRRHPEVEILASARAWEILRMPKGIETIHRFSRLVQETMGLAEACSAYDWEWRDDISGATVSEGDRIDLGNLQVEIIETPGHSSCSISAYVPSLKALFPSDGGGIPYRDTIILLGNSNYTAAQHSLEKLEGLEVEVLCADHYGHVLGEEARHYIRQAIEVARQRRVEMEEAYRKAGGNIEAAAQERVRAFYIDYPDFIIPREITFGIQIQMLRHIAQALEGPGNRSQGTGHKP